MKRFDGLDDSSGLGRDDRVTHCIYTTLTLTHAHAHKKPTNDRSDKFRHACDVRHGSSMIR